MAAVTICSDFGAPQNKVWHYFHCFPIYFPWSDGTRSHDLRFPLGTTQTVKRLSTMRETRVWSLGWKDPLEKEMAIHSRTIAWKIPWTEEPGRLQSMGSQRVRHDWATSLHFKRYIEASNLFQLTSMCSIIFCTSISLSVENFSSSTECPTLCDPMDCSSPGSSVHGILQACILEWVAIPFSRGSSQPRDWIQVSHLAGRAFTIWDTRKPNVNSSQLDI